jgi:peptide/nickel transport system substrate-binding protein
VRQCGGLTQECNRNIMFQATCKTAWRHKEEVSSKIVKLLFYLAKGRVTRSSGTWLLNWGGYKMVVNKRVKGIAGVAMLVIVITGLFAVPLMGKDAFVTVVQGTEPWSLDPTMCIGKNCITVQNALFDPLMYHSSEGELIPWLASSWEATDPLTWRIHLRENVKFHNGESFNADAVDFTLETYNSSTGEGRAYYQYVDHTVVIDDYTIDIVTKKPNAVVPETLSLMYVLPPKYYDEVGQASFSQNPIGTGPFRFIKWDAGIEIRVQRNTNYWRGIPQIEGVVFKQAGEASTRVAFLLTGEADIIENLPPEMVGSVEASDKAHVESVPSMRKIMVEFNKEISPLNDVRVRKAFNYAIDKESLIKYILGGFAERSKGVLLPGMVGYDPSQLVAYDYNPEEAKQLLAEAGYSDGLTVDFWYPIGRYLKDEEVAEAIAGMLEEVGVHCDMHGMDIGSLCQKMHAHQNLSGMHFFSVAPLYNDPDYQWRAHFWSEGLNQYAADATTDKLLEEGIVITDVDKRAKIYQELEQYITNELVPWIFLYNQALIYGVSDRLDWKSRPDEIIDLREASLLQ